MMKTIIAVLFCLLAAPMLCAHPHVFIESSAEFVWNKKELSGVWLEWTFDRFFSADIINWLDANHDGRFDKTETDEIYNKAFINLRHYYYYTFIRQGSERSNPPRVENFSAHQAAGLMTYRFFIDLSVYAGKELYFAVYDYTYFCDIRYSETQPIKLSYDASGVKPSYVIVENKDYPVYYDPLGAIDDTTVYYKWKKGLQTYYPKEILIAW